MYSSVERDETSSALQAGTLLPACSSRDHTHARAFLVPRPSTVDPRALDDVSMCLCESGKRFERIQVMLRKPRFSLGAARRLAPHEPPVASNDGDGVDRPPATLKIRWSFPFQTEVRVRALGNARAHRVEEKKVAAHAGEHDLGLGT